MTPLARPRNAGTPMPPGAVSSVGSVITAGQVAQNCRPKRHLRGHFPTELGQEGPPRHLTVLLADLTAPGPDLTAPERARSALSRPRRGGYLRLCAPLTDPTELTALLRIPISAGTQRKEETLTDTTGFYDEVRDTARLPRQSNRDHRVVCHGFAAQIGGSGTSTWFFFEHLEPALVFGRSARQSLRIGSYGVHPAAEELASKPGARDRRILHVIRSERLDRRDDEHGHFLKWADMCDVASAYWPPTPRHLMSGKP